MGLISHWMLLGPFENEDGKGHTQAFPPEQKIDFAEKYIGKGGQEVAWFPFKGQDWRGMVDLTALFTPTDWATAYAVCYVTSEKEQAVQFRMGSNDSLKAWLNDSMVLESQATRGVTVDNDTVSVTLPKGTSRIMLKISNTAKAWGFCFRITDDTGAALKGVRYSLHP
jgi:hypothetical protein